MTRPTPRAVFLFALAVPLALPVATGWPQVWFFALYWPGAVLALMAADLVMTPPGHRLRAEVNAPGRLYVGRPGEVTARLSVGGSTRPLPVEALLEQSGEAEAPVPVAGATAGGRLELRLTVRPLRRGLLRIEALWLRWRGPLGLIERGRRQPLDLALEVVPDVRGLPEAALRFFAQDAAYGQKSQRFKGEGAEFDNLTDYAPGRDSRFIDWKHSARHRKLLCKEFRQERNHQIVLAFDTGHLMLEPVEGLSKLDRTIKAGLLLAWASLYNGDLVGGCGFDARFRHFLQPGRGLPYFRHFQRFTAGLSYQTEETNFTLGLAELGSRLKRRALVILFTEFVDTISAELLLESLGLLTRRHLVIFVTMRDPLLARLTETPPDDFARVARAVIADDFARERAVVLERVARLGVHCLDTPAPALSAALLNRYLLIKQRGLL